MYGRVKSDDGMTPDECSMVVVLFEKSLGSNRGRTCEPPIIPIVDAAADAAEVTYLVLVLCAVRLAVAASPQEPRIDKTRGFGPPRVKRDMRLLMSECAATGIFPPERARNSDLVGGALLPMMALVSATKDEPPFEKGGSVTLWDIGTDGACSPPVAVAAAAAAVATAVGVVVA
jgi:hypothetical protein